MPRKMVESRNFFVRRFLTIDTNILKKVISAAKLVHYECIRLQLLLLINDVQHNRFYTL